MKNLTTVLAEPTALKKQAKNKKGFTLVELVIVIAVLAIIAAIAIPTVTNVINNANAAADKTNAQSIETAIKTAESEVAANATNSSDRVTALGSSGTLETLLKTYGVDSTSAGLGDGTDTLKVSGDHFYYDSTSGKVVAAASAPTTGYKQLKKTADTYSIANSTLTLSIS